MYQNNQSWERLITNIFSPLKRILFQKEPNMDNFF